MTVQEKIPETIQEVKDHFMNLGLKVFPLSPGTKIPFAGFKYDDMLKKDYNFILTGDENLAMAHDKETGTFAIDIDFKDKSHTVNEAINVLFEDVEKTLDSTLVIKTPKQGVHFIFESEDGYLPPQIKYYSNKYPGVEIDIRSNHGYTVLPPSIHPEKKYGKYNFISNTLTPAKMKWENVEMVLAKRGFFIKGKSTHIPHADENDISKLLMGRFPRGSRRKSQNALYIMLRIRDKTEQESKDAVIKVNRSCSPPLDDGEIDKNINYAETYYQNTVKPELEAKKNLKSPRSKFGHYAAAEELMSEYDFISHISGEIYYYAGGIYHPHGDLLIKKKSRQYWESIGIESKHIAEIINIIKDKTMILSDDGNQEIFDTDYKKIILKNGMYDFETNTFSDHDSKILSTIKHPIYYDESKSCPKFDSFLKSCMDGDDKKITQIWELMALCFIKKYIIQKGYVLYGIGSNGKSTFLSILRNMIGMGYTSSITMQDFQRSRFTGYDLRGKCANISADGGTEPIIKTGMIKKILGGDQITCEEKFKSSFDFLPFTTMIFTFNELPVVNDSSDGFARKIQLIHWNQRFYGDKKDPSVDDIAFDSDERSGIFNKLIPIINRLLKERKLSHESTVQETKKIWLSRSDSFFKFKNEMIIKGPKYRISVRDLIDAYHDFCTDNGMTPIRDTVFSSKISEILDNTKPYTSRIDDKSVKLWKGVTVIGKQENEQTHL